MDGIMPAANPGDRHALALALLASLPAHARSDARAADAVPVPGAGPPADAHPDLPGGQGRTRALRQRRPGRPAGRLLRGAGHGLAGLLARGAGPLRSGLAAAWPSILVPELSQIHAGSKLSSPSQSGPPPALTRDTG